MSAALGSERAERDAYWTPLPCARACCAALRDVGVAPQTILEPAVGGGSWVQAARETWAGVAIDALDIDADAPGLRTADAHQVRDFMEFPGFGYDLILGNPPYSGDLEGWVRRSLTAGADVAYVMRATFLGSVGRLSFFEACPPSDVWVLAPRPQWGGPGARTTTDTTDSILVLWRLHWRQAPHLHWLHWSRSC